VVEEQAISKIYNREICLTAYKTTVLDKKKSQSKVSQSVSQVIPLGIINQTSKLLPVSRHSKIWIYKTLANVESL